MNRIPLVEDHERPARLTCSGLEAAGIAADIVHRGDAAWAAIQQVPYAAPVLDRGLPDGDGLALLQRLRARGFGIARRPMRLALQILVQGTAGTPGRAGGIR